MVPKRFVLCVSAIDNRADARRRRTVEHIEAGDFMALLAQRKHQRFAEMSGAACDQCSHAPNAHETDFVSNEVAGETQS